MTPNPADGGASPAPKRYGTFAGVFTPTLLTILGVIMYLRLGWVVGNAGLLGGWLILLLASGITAATGLSLSSIATNTRLGAGGPYAIISRSLGLEDGGSVGVPLLRSLELAVAMYIFGFREGWLWIFPDHPPLVVDLAIFGVVFAIAFASAGLAFRIQYVVIVVIVASLVAILGNVEVWTSDTEIQWWGKFPGSPESEFAGTNFWVVFAVFFPAATGILAGANMSGELRNPRRSIPLGTLSAIGLSTAIYVALTVWLVRAAEPDELVRNYTVMIDRSLWGPLVLAGLLGATFSSALSSLVGAPRILAALSADELLATRGWLSRTSSGGEPRRAMLVTGAIVLAALMVRDLNIIAPLITMFFLITYAVINVVILVEASLGLISFRPTFRLPRLVPLLGAVGCVFAMFIVNPTFGLVAVAVVVGIYFWILKRKLGKRTDDVRSGIFVAFAEWAAARVISHEMTNVRAWKPNLLVPVEDPARVRGDFQVLVDLCRPEGTIKLLGLATRDTVAELTPRLDELGKQFRRNGVFTTGSVLDSTGFSDGIVAGLQALGSAFFRPNTVFFRLPSDPARYEPYRAVMGEVRRLRLGVMLLALHDEAGMGRSKVINLWIKPRVGEQSVADVIEQGNGNLAILAAYRLARAWEAQLNLIAVVESADEADAARAFVDELRDLTRIPSSARTRVLVGDLETAIGHAPQSDLDILGTRSEIDLDFVRRMVEASRSACLFTADSGQESALA